MRESEYLSAKLAAKRLLEKWGNQNPPAGSAEFLHLQVLRHRIKQHESMTLGTPPPDTEDFIKILQSVFALVLAIAVPIGQPGLLL